MDYMVGFLSADDRKYEQYTLNFISIYDVEDKRMISVGVSVNFRINDLSQEDMSFNIHLPYDREYTLAFIEEQSIAIAKERIRMAAAGLDKDISSVV